MIRKIKKALTSPIPLGGMKSGFAMAVDFNMHWQYNRNNPDIKLSIEDLEDCLKIFEN